jgi:hypothetical protein
MKILSVILLLLSQTMLTGCGALLFTLMVAGEDNPSPQSPTPTLWESWGKSLKSQSKPMTSATSPDTVEAVEYKNVR